VREAAPSYAELVARAPRLTLLVTSRAVLHIRGEHVVPVAPLQEDDAVTLFTQRARLLDPDFELTPGNEPDVREVCRRVDCLPLAVELAAARLRTLTPRALRERLSDRLALLTSGPRDLPARQQTLRETIAWSVDLLGAGERDVLARLAVFPGGASLVATEAVCGATVDSLASLVDDHLLQRLDVAEQPRFGMLETIREYALELLGDRRPAVEALMGSYFADLLDAVENEAQHSGEAAVARVDPEIDNVRAAIETAAAVGNAEVELRLAGSLWRYFWVRGLAGEGLRRIEGALERSESGASPALARALKGGGGLAWSLGDLERARRLGIAAIATAAEVGSPLDEISANTLLGAVANDEGDREAARSYHRRSIEIGEQIGIEPVIPMLNLGIVALDSGDYDDARDLFEDVLAIHRRNDTVSGIGFASINLGVVHYALGDHAASLEAFREAHERFEQIGFRAHVAHAVQGFAAYEASEDRFEEAARMLGQARAVLDEVGSPEADFAVDMVAWVKEQARAALGDEGFEAAYAAGRATPSEGQPSTARGTRSRSPAP
jgi:predicted ATPase